MTLRQAFLVAAVKTRSASARSALYPCPGLAHSPEVRRADIDAYNLGQPFPILQWIADRDGAGLPIAEYRAFASPKELLNAIGRGVEPLAQSVREAAHPVIDIDRLPHSNPTKQQTRPRAAFARSGSLSIDEMPRFFRYDYYVYLAGPMQLGGSANLEISGTTASHGPARLHRVCLFDAHMPTAHLPDHALSLGEIATLERSAGPLLPTGRLCAGIGDEARTLADHAAWRPWVLYGRRSTPSGLSGDQLALYMRNRALTGPENIRQYRAYIAARAAAVEALAPFYRDEFGRTPAEAKRLASLYLDRKISDGFEFDPDDDAATALLSADYAGKHAEQQAALAGDTAALREALGPEPRAVAKGIRGVLDEPLVTMRSSTPRRCARSRTRSRSTRSAPPAACLRRRQHGSIWSRPPVFCLSMERSRRPSQGCRGADRRELATRCA